MIFLGWQIVEWLRTGVWQSYKFASAPLGPITGWAIPDQVINHVLVNYEASLITLLLALWLDQIFGVLQNYGDRKVAKQERLKYEKMNNPPAQSPSFTPDGIYKNITYRRLPDGRIQWQRGNQILEAKSFEEFDRRIGQWRSAK